MNLLITTLLFLFAVSPCHIHAEPPKPLSFQQLHGLNSYLPKEASVTLLQREMAAVHQKTICIRGFLYQTDAGRWLLAATPNMKSCCVGSSDKITQQIFLSAPFTAPAKAAIEAVSVQGTFSIEPLWDAQGNLTQLFSLKEALILHEERWSIPHLCFAALLVLGLALLYKNARKMQVA
jgi:hypothetical protein